VLEDRAGIETDLIGSNPAPVAVGGQGVGGDGRNAIARHRSIERLTRAAMRPRWSDAGSNTGGSPHEKSVTDR
jgi:hypothetical protein